MSFTDEELHTIHRLCDYVISRRDHFHTAASGKDGIIAKAEQLDEKVLLLRMPWTWEDIEK